MNSTTPSSANLVSGIVAAGPPVSLLIGMAIGAFLVLAYLAGRERAEPGENT